MADVYKATDRKLNRSVAVKVMKPEFAGDGGFISRFKREAQSAAGLTHPNIVNVYDVGEDQGNYFIVMELVEGITLKDYIAKKGKLSVKEATSIAIQVCMGVAAAHDQGIVHRDVKPQNIIISTDGKVKVTDFGIARAASSNTISTNVMGSVHYSSPEQVRGGYSDARSDIYSVGVTLYEMVTGKVPFDGDSPVVIAIKHLQEEMESPSNITPDLPYALEQIIYKCMQKSVERRYQSMNDVIADLKRSLQEPDGHFVTLQPMSDRAQTICLTKEEEAEIKKAAEEKGKYQAIPESETYSSTSEARNGKKRKFDPYEDDDDDDDESSGWEKFFTIGSLIIGVLLIIALAVIIIFAINKVGSNGGGDTSKSTISADQIQVPRIIDKDETDAKYELNRLGLGSKCLGDKSSDKPAGTVLEQDPAEGSFVDKNTTVTYYRSSGPREPVVPYVIGKTLTEAQSLLTAAGYENITTQKQESDEVPIGNVVNVTPGEGEKVSVETEIVLVVSTGPSGGSGQKVGSYIGVEFATAKQLCEQMGMVVITNYGNSDSVAVGEVMSQSVPYGTPITNGMQIVLTVNDPEHLPEITNTPTPEPTSEPKKSWFRRVKLLKPADYNDGGYRLVFHQDVNGESVDTILAEGNALEFPYIAELQGYEGIEEGYVLIYELIDGELVPKAQWNVTFSEEGD